MIHQPILLQDISLRFSKKTCFEHFTAKIFAGSRIAIISRNGSGKSTLLNMLMDLHNPSSGELCVPTDDPVFVASKNHPLFRETQLTLKDITQYPLIMVSFMNDPTDNYLDRLIKSQGLSATVFVVVPHALIALQSLPNSQFITHTVKGIAAPIASQIGLGFLPTPIDLISKKADTPYVAHQYWHKTTAVDPGNQWLRQAIEHIVSKHMNQRKHG